MTEYKIRVGLCGSTSVGLITNRFTNRTVSGQFNCILIGNADH